MGVIYKIEFVEQDYGCRSRIVYLTDSLDDAIAQLQTHLTAQYTTYPENEHYFYSSDYGYSITWQMKRLHHPDWFTVGTFSIYGIPMRTFAPNLLGEIDQTDCKIDPENKFPGPETQKYNPDA